MATERTGFLFIPLFMIHVIMSPGWGVSHAREFTSKDAHILVQQKGASTPLSDVMPGGVRVRNAPGDSSRVQILLALLDRLSQRRRTPPIEGGFNPSTTHRNLRPLTRVYSNLALVLPWVQIAFNPSREWGLVLPGSDRRVASDPKCPPFPSEMRQFFGIRPRYVATINRVGGLHVLCTLVLHHSTGIPKYVINTDEMNRDIMMKFIPEEIQRIFRNLKEDSNSETSFGKSSNSPPSPRIMGSNPITSNSLDQDRATWPSKNHSGEKKKINGMLEESDTESEFDNIHHRKTDPDPGVKPIHSQDTRFVAVLVLFITTFAVLLTGILVLCVICLKAKRIGNNQSVTPHSYRHHAAEVPPWFSTNSKGYNFSKTVLNSETSPSQSCVSDEVLVEDDSIPLSPSTNPSHGAPLTVTINRPKIGRHIGLTHTQKLQGKLDVRRARPNGAGAVPPVIP